MNRVHQPANTSHLICTTPRPGAEFNDPGQISPGEPARMARPATA